MGSLSILPNLNMKVMSKSLLLRQGKRKIGAFLDIIHDGVGDDGIILCIQKNRSIGSFVHPEKLAEFRGKASTVSFVGIKISDVADQISDEEFASVLPEWLIRLIISQGEQGQIWMKEQIAWLRELF